jgi:hypothetical protein
MAPAFLTMPDALPQQRPKSVVPWRMALWAKSCRKRQIQRNMRSIRVFPDCPVAALKASANNVPLCASRRRQSTAQGDDMNAQDSFIATASLIGGSALAEEPGRLAPLPDQLPPSVEARLGKVEFSRGLPTQKGIEQLFDIQDFQRATQLYQWAIPAIGVMGWHRASIANGNIG